MSSPILDAVRDEFQKIKKLADKAIEQLSDDDLHVKLDDESNSVAVIMRHMAGNMRSRWTDFLTADGEKPDRQRDREFDDVPQSRAELLAEWEDGWQRLFDALGPLTDADLQRTVIIRARAAFRLQGHQPPGGALRGPRLPDPHARQAPEGRGVDHAVGAARAVRGVQPPHDRATARRELARNPPRHVARPLGPARHGPHQSSPDSRDARVRALRASSRSPAATPDARRGARARVGHPRGRRQLPGAARARATSMPSTSRCPTACTWSGRSRHRRGQARAVREAHRHLRRRRGSHRRGRRARGRRRRRRLHVPARAAHHRGRRSGARVAPSVRSAPSSRGSPTRRAAPTTCASVRALGGGALWDVGCYPVSYACLLTGRDHEMVAGVARVTRRRCRRRADRRAAASRPASPPASTPASAPRIAPGSR